MYSAQYIGFIDFPFDCTQVPRRLTQNVSWHSIASWFPEIMQKRLFLSNDNTQYQVTRPNKQLWVTGLTFMTTETYASFFMCIINIHLDVHFFYFNCYGNCYSFFLKTLNANGLNNYSVHSTFFEFRSNTKCLPLRISLDFLYSIDIIVDCI